ncbi:DEAD/DEAH box helicase [Catellicoccus marimammalium]|uniref:DEAD-box ATP-dependent RNA helicase CshA n=1 Tax=Catellicoccus marimammalium M35/04/3 TaxID=1234409 RepID=K8Z939_9ENTE|nr:DEAD/DEAH box helicase [Catellicoccus marimammalium]EKU27524.1 Cold-shock DEAD-box protein A [Catellicoccus marimammalium M35/04/3]
MKFKDLGLAEDILKSVESVGFEEATPIQEQTIPLVLAGKDVIGQAQTGTGKTAAFGLPTIQNIDAKKEETQALVIAPTRELAIQTQEELYRLSKERRLKVQAVYGGADINRQIRILKKNPQIVVGTPGRLLDHIQRGTLKLNHVKVLVLDEADEMLNMGFLDDIESIIKSVPNDRQTLLFSATMPEDIKRIGVQFMKNPEHVQIKAKEMTASLIDQYFMRVKEFEKFDILTRLLDVHTPELSIIFGRTKRRVDELSRALESRGYKAEGIHGDLSQQKRMDVLKAFKKGELDILVATDVAARGLDISGVTHVYNFDIPQDPESYVHRIGRTGRAGKDGMSVTFVTPNEMSYLQTIEKLTKKRMTPLKPPTKKEAFAGQMQSAMEEIAQKLENTDLDRYVKQADQLLEQYSAIDLTALLLKVVAKEDINDIPVKITPERPLPAGKKQRSRRHDRYKDRRRHDYKDHRKTKERNGKPKGKGKAKNKNKERNFTIRQK